MIFFGQPFFEKKEKGVPDVAIYLYESGMEGGGGPSTFAQRLNHLSRASGIKKGKERRWARGNLEKETVREKKEVLPNYTGGKGIPQDSVPCLPRVKGREKRDIQQLSPFRQERRSPGAMG